MPVLFFFHESNPFLYIGSGPSYDGNIFMRNHFIFQQTVQTRKTSRNRIGIRTKLEDSSVEIDIPDNLPGFWKRVSFIGWNLMMTF